MQHAFSDHFTEPVNCMKPCASASPTSQWNTLPMTLRHFQTLPKRTMVRLLQPQERIPHPQHTPHCQGRALPLPWQTMLRRWRQHVQVHNAVIQTVLLHLAKL